MNVKNLITFKKSSFSTRNSSLLLFTNLSGIIDGLVKLSSYTPSPHTTVVWPVETCREISLIQKLRRFPNSCICSRIPHCSLTNVELGLYSPRSSRSQLD